MPSVVASSEAYTKTMLHCHKYPTQPVLGVLVGKRINSSTSSAGGDCYVTDAYPLFHSTALTAPHPMLEVAYAHCHSAARTSGLTLLGVYIANERLDDHGLSDTHARPVLDFFAARLGLSGNGAKDRLLVWFVDNESMASPPSGIAVTSFYYEPGVFPKAVPLPAACAAAAAAAPLTALSFGRWNSDTLAPEATVAVESVMEATSNALDGFAQYRLVDLEDHFENPELNYLEQPLNTLTARKK